MVQYTVLNKSFRWSCITGPPKLAKCHSCHIVTTRGFVTSKIQIDHFLGPGAPKLPKIELVANFSERGDTDDYLGEIIRQVTSRNLKTMAKFLGGHRLTGS